MIGQGPRRGAGPGLCVWGGLQASERLRPSPSRSSCGFECCPRALVPNLCLALHTCSCPMASAFWSSVCPRQSS